MARHAELASITTFTELRDYLRDALGWPLGHDDFDDLTFEYELDELGLDEEKTPKIRKMNRLRPLTPNQPWAIVFIEFERKRLPVVALRRILRLLVKRGRDRNAADRKTWDMHDILFITSIGDDDDRKLTFAHFSDESNKGDLPTLRVLGWDGDDTALKVKHVESELKTKLHWPDNTADVAAWRESWSRAFTLKNREVITTSKRLAERLAALARAIRNRALTALEIESKKGPLRSRMEEFKKALIHDLDEKQFADMYAQTIAYGLLSARVSRRSGALVADDAALIIPNTNPFLKELLADFIELGGRQRPGRNATRIDFDELGVNDVVQMLREANMEAVLRDFGDRNPQEDPVIHFYEVFLKEYDAKERMRRGVFYTPRPVVSYIVRSVDELLQTEFGLADGLADTTTWGEMVKRHSDLKIPEGVSPDQDFVQILDPATGTGTFLVEVIDLIHKKLVAKWKAEGLRQSQIIGRWNEYVARHLLTRLHGYELLMAPYAIAHLKIGLKLAETGYSFESDERARVYLTNALEPASDFSGTFTFAIPALAHEAQSVNEVKRHKRFTVVIGNPPYSGHSSNTGAWISQLVRDYYVVDGAPLGETNTKWLQDDYVKFTRLGQVIIATAGIGIFSHITNHGYIDNPTFRGMRQQLLNTFSKLFLLDLHGNSNKQEASPDGSKDVNVFEIQQGVAILAGVRMPTKVLVRAHGDLFGLREDKYAYLSGHTIWRTSWSEVSPASPLYYFMPQDALLLNEYQHCLGIQQMFGKTLLGPNSHRDDFAISFEREVACERLADLADRSKSDTELRQKYSLQDNRDWSLKAAREYDFRNEKPVRCLYRPFDFRWMLYGSYAFDYHRPEINDSLLKRNLALISTRQTKEKFSVFVTARPAGQHKLATAYDGSYLSPLFLYRNESDLDLEGDKQSNLHPHFVATLNRILGDALTPEDTFHYAYAVFHSPAYRRRYAEFLKIDFPRLPLTGNLELFRALARLGGELVALHLLESPTLDTPITRFVGRQNPEVEKVSWSDETVWIDKAKTTGFAGVREAVWNFHIGGYQVCEKWLKDRKGRVLSADDIAHYQKVVVALSETIRLMREIDEVIDEHGGWPGAFQTGQTDISE